MDQWEEQHERWLREKELEQLTEEAKHEAESLSEKKASSKRVTPTTRTRTRTAPRGAGEQNKIQKTSGRFTRRTIRQIPGSEIEPRVTTGPQTVSEEELENIDERIKNLEDSIPTPNPVKAPARDPRLLRSIKEIVPSYNPPDPGQLPEEVPIRGEEYLPRVAAPTSYPWEASNIYHNPLYFQDEDLERYGHSHHQLLQPFVSVGKFGAQALSLPYKMVLDPPKKKKYILGHYQPGEFVPYKRHRIPWNAEATGTEVGVAAGMILLFP